MLLKRLKLHQITRIFRWSGTTFFLQTCMQNYTIFVKNGVVLHHLATLFENTNEVSKPDKGDQIVHGILPNIYEILPVSLPNYK